MKQGKGPVYGHCKYCKAPFWSKWGLDNHEANTCKERAIEAPEIEEPAKRYRPSVAIGGAIVWARK